MRADALRSRRKLLDAASALLLDRGTEPPLDAIARRAEVGIGTLYRHFPDRAALLEAVAHDALEQAIASAEAALADAADGQDAVRRYLHAAVRGGVGALNLLHPMLDDPDWSEQRERVVPLLAAILDRGRRDGTLRDDVDATDVVVAVIRFSRPVELGWTPEQERTIAHRQLDRYVDGLGAPGPAGR